MSDSFLDPMDYRPPGSYVHEVFQIRILEWVAVSVCRGSSPPRDQTCVSCIAGGFFPTAPPGLPFFGVLMPLNAAPKDAASLASPQAWSSP